MEGGPKKKHLLHASLADSNSGNFDYTYYQNFTVNPVEGISVSNNDDSSMMRICKFSSNKVHKPGEDLDRSFPVVLESSQVATTQELTRE